MNETTGQAMTTTDLAEALRQLDVDAIEALGESLLADAPVEQLTAAADALADRLAGPAGIALRERDRVGYRRSAAVIARLNAQADRIDTEGIDRLLLSFGGKPQVILDLVARSARPPIQRVIGDALGIGADYTSKVLRAMEAADLVTRRRQGRVVLIELTGLGRSRADAASLQKGEAADAAWLAERISVRITEHVKAGARARRVPIIHGELVGASPWGA